MSQVLIVFAQHAEARATIERVQAKAIADETTHIWGEGELPCRYQFDKGWIVLSGVGVHGAQMCVAKHAHLCDEIWNLGLSGALGDSLPIGKICAIQSVAKYVALNNAELDHLTLDCITSTLPQFSLNGEGAEKLISSDFPIHDPLHRKKLAQTWNLVDMEGYGIAYAAASLKKRCRMWKIVSDFASPGGRELIRKNKSAHSDSLAELILKYLQ